MCILEKLYINTFEIKKYLIGPQNLRKYYYSNEKIEIGEFRFLWN